MRMKRTKAHQWALNRVANDPTYPKPIPPAERPYSYGATLGMITGVAEHSIPRLPSDRNWARSVPGQYRVAGSATVWTPVNRRHDEDR